MANDFIDSSFSAILAWRQSLLNGSQLIHNIRTYVESTSVRRFANRAVGHQKANEKPRTRFQELVKVLNGLDKSGVTPHHCTTTSASNSTPDEFNQGACGAHSIRVRIGRNANDFLVWSCVCAKPAGVLGRNVLRHGHFNRGRRITFRARLPPQGGGKR